MKSFFKSKRIVVKDELDGERYAREDYLQEMMSFTRPIDDEKRIGQGISNLVEYDLVCDFGKTGRDGHLLKRFVRLHNSYFVKFFSDAKKRRTSYQTYLIDEDLAQGIKPENVSVLIKEIGQMYGLYNEIELKKMYSEAIGSRVLDFFGCKTVYNRAICDGAKYYVASIDFLKPAHYFFSAGEIAPRNEIATYFPLKHNINVLLDDVDILKKEICSAFGVQDVVVDKEQIVKDFVSSYLVRVMLLGDTDFKSANYGLIYDRSKNEIVTAPNYDFEFALGTPAKHLSNFDENFRFIQENYPDSLNEFFEKLEDFAKNRLIIGPKYKGIVHKEIDNEVVRNSFNKFFELNADYIFKFRELALSVDAAAQKQ